MDYFISLFSDWLIELYNIVNLIYKENEINVSYSYIYKNLLIVKICL